MHIAPWLFCVVEDNNSVTIILPRTALGGRG